MATYTYTVVPPFVSPDGLVAPSGETAPLEAPGGLVSSGAQTVNMGDETTRSMDWDGVSVKEEPVDWSESMPLQQTELMNPEYYDDQKDYIPASSLGEVHYIMADPNQVVCGERPSPQLENPVSGAVDLEVKQEEDASQYVMPLMIKPIKEEEEEEGQVPLSVMPPSTLSKELSYLDDPRMSLSPRDHEIDAPQSEIGRKASLSASDNLISRTKVLQSKVNNKGSPGKKLPKAKFKVVQPQAKSTTGNDQVLSKQINKVSPKLDIVRQKPGPKCSKVLPMKDGSIGKVMLQKQNALKHKIGKIPLSKFIPCVVQLCEIPRCGIDCTCTIKAPYPDQLKAVTLSTRLNETSLNFFANKKVSSTPMVPTQPVSASTQGTGNSRENVQNMGFLMNDRTGVGKRKSKLSEKLKGYMEERNKVRESKLKMKKTILACPICEKQLHSLHNFKRHLISHDVNDILNINISPKLVPVDNAAKAKQAQKKKKIDAGKAESKHAGAVASGKNAVPQCSRYTAIRALLEEQLPQQPLQHLQKLQPQEQQSQELQQPPETLSELNQEQVVEPPTNKHNKKDKPSPVVLNIPQFKAGTSQKDNHPIATVESFSLGCGEIVTFESGKKTNEARITVGLPDASETSAEMQSTKTKGVDTEGGANVDKNVDDNSRVFVIAPINDFSPPNMTATEKETKHENKKCRNTPKDVPDCQPIMKLKETKKMAKRQSFEKSKKAMKMQLLNERIVGKARSQKVKPREPILEELSQALLKNTAIITPSSADDAESDIDSDATAPYGDDDDDNDKEYVPVEKQQPEKAWSKVTGARKSTGGNYWINKLAKEKVKNALKAKGKKTETKSIKASRDGVSAQSEQGNEQARQNVEPPGQNEDVLNASEDRDSGIDLESDGSEKKKSVKKPISSPFMTQNDKMLKMLSGELVSRRELWGCVNSQLDNRKQREVITCPMCDKTFNYPSAIKRHIMMHTDEREFECPHCPKAFSRKPHLTEHIRVHTGERPYKCTYCPAAFAQRTNLMIHTRTHTGARPFKCPECGKRFRRQDAHTQHILTHHSNVKPYKCEDCTAAFPCARYLKDHRRVHSKERPFKCGLCAAAFVCKKYLLLHVRALHLNERPFVCKLCPAKFAQSGKLTEHNRVHTGEKPYKCSSCGSCFSRSGHLRRHLLTHTGIRPHKCTHCTATFSQVDHLKRHVKNIHKVSVADEVDEGVYTLRPCS